MVVELVSTIAIVALVGLILLEVPVAFSLMLSGVLGLVLLGQPMLAFSNLAAAPYAATAKYDLLVLPMFILLGAFVSNAGIAAKIFDAANRLVGWLPGGLGVATIFACTLFGGISGSSAADVATIGRVSVTAMRHHGYSARFAAGLVAAAGTVAILIPPSIPLVVYGILTGIPISSLLLAGILPGVFTALTFALYVVGRSVWRDRFGSSGRKCIRTSAPQMPRTSLTIAGGGSAVTRFPFVGIVYALVLFTIIVGGLYSGFFTTTEAAAVGAFAALLISVPEVRSNGGSVVQLVKESMRETAGVTSMLFALLVGTAIFSYFLAATRLPIDLTAWITSLNVSPKVVVLVFLALLIPLGMILDGLSMMLLTVPIAFPALQALGVDGVWFGILVVTMIELGLITPPVGINVYIIAGLIDDLSLEDAFAGVTPFIFIQLFITVVLFLYPEIVLFLPNLAKG